MSSVTLASAQTVSGGEVYVCDAWNHRVVVFGLDGSFVRAVGHQRQWGGAAQSSSWLVTDLGNARVQVFNLDGSFVRQWGSRGGGAGQFDDPWGVAVSEGKVFVGCEHRIQVFQ